MTVMAILMTASLPVNRLLAEVGNSGPARDSGRRVRRGFELEDFREAVMKDKPVPHDGRWGKATLEVCLAILESSRERREVTMAHQASSPY